MIGLELGRSLHVHLAWPGSSVYEAGRGLAAEVYRSTWNTPSLRDQHALGVVALLGERAIANVNLETARGGGDLPSEHYFAARHWRSCFDVERAQVGEVGALAIEERLDFGERELALLGVMYGLCVGARVLGLRILSTVEHRALARRMKGYLGLPLVQNEQVVEPTDHTPNDVYWRGNERPALYYMDMLDPELVGAAGSIQVYLTARGVTLEFASNTAGAQNYPAFREWLRRVRSAPESARGAA